MLSFSPDALLTLDLPEGQFGDAWRYQNRGTRSVRHHHPEVELNIVLRGGGTYLAGRRRYDLAPGSLAWLFPEQEHVLTAKSSDLEMWIVVFGPELIAFCGRGDSSRELRSGDPDGHFCRPVSPGQIAALTRICEDAASAPSADRRNAALAYLLASAWDAYQSSGEGEDQPHVHPAVRRAAHLLRGEGEGASVPEIARAAGLSVSRLSDVFRRETGVTLTEFRNQCRLERFTELYGAGGRTTMLEAALAAGFGSYLQFYRVFHKAMGCGPSEYKRRT